AGGIDNYCVGLLPRRLDEIDQLPFMVRLMKCELRACQFGELLAARFDRSERGGTVDVRLAHAEEVEIRPVQNHQTHCDPSSKADPGRYHALTPTEHGRSCKLAGLVRSPMGGFATVGFEPHGGESGHCCSVRRSKMRHLVCVCLREGRASRGARGVVTTGGMSFQPVEPIDEAQHIRHEYVGDGEGPG